MNELIAKPELSDVSKCLYEAFEERNIAYLTWDKDLSDFRKSQPITLCAYAKDLIIKFPILRNYLSSFAGMLGAALFNPSKVIICWDIKQLFSYFRYHLPRNFRFPISCRFVDLKLMESYMDIHLSKPTSYQEATDRARTLMGNDRLLKVNTEIYTPLACEVLPSIETLGLANKDTKQVEFCYYVIEGSVNGRLTSKQAFDGCFMPLNSSQEDRKRYVAGHERKFLAFDYKHYEASVLQWLSSDPKLGAIIDSDKDVYETIYKLINNSKVCTTEGRTLIKNIFLPFAYGLGVNGIAEKEKISINGAKYLVEKLISLFPVAFEWIKSWEGKIKKDPITMDCFGRKFNFAQREPNGVRCAVVQSPAALVSLEKLIKLYQQKCASMEVVATVHDACVCTVDRQLVQTVADHIKEILESPSALAPELKLKVKVVTGDNWGEMKEL